MKECIGDVLMKMNRKSAIPDSFIFQPSGVEERWRQKRGMKRLALYDDESIRRLKDCFDQLDLTKNGLLEASEIEELLISFGLAIDREQVEQILAKMDSDEKGRIDFAEFINLLKEAPAHLK